MRIIKKFLKWGFIGFTGLIVVIVIIANLSPEEEEVETEQSKPQQEVSYKYVTEGNSIEREVEKLIVEVMGGNVNWEEEPRTVKEVYKIEQVNGGYLVKVKYRANENLTVNMARKGIIIDCMDFAEKLYTDSKYSEIVEFMLMPYLTFVDQYGNESEDQVGKLVLDRSTGEKINWENMYQDRFRDILENDGQLWFHPAIRK